MKQLIRKELREHFKVALIGLAALSVLLIQAFLNCMTQLERATFAMGATQGDELQPLLADSLLVQVSFFCAVFGALLGWLQIRAEKHPDLWAFLVHRPISRTQILRSKLFAGLLLYGLGAGVPMLGLIIVAVIPGNVAAPFEWAMTLPLIAIFLLGLMYYLAGLLTGIRKARWYASRGFGLGLAVVAHFGVFQVPEFWQALIFLAISGGILSLAVGGSFRSGGYYSDQGTLGKVALTTACTVSAALLVVVILGGVFTLFSSRRDYTYSQYQLTRDGTLYKLTSHGYDAPEIVDLSGQPLLDEKTGQKIKLPEFQKRGAVGLSVSVRFADSEKRNTHQEQYLDTARFFSPWRVWDKTLWYLTHDGRLVGYHGVTRRPVGSLEPSDVPAGGSPANSRFLRPQDYAFSYLNPYAQPEILTTAKTAYLVDLEKRQLAPLFTVTNRDDVIGGYAQTVIPNFPAASNKVLVVTRSSISLLDFEGKSLMRVPYQPAYPAYPSVSVFSLEPTNAYAVRFDPDYLLNRKSGGKLLSRVEWVNADGSVRHAMDLPKLPEPRQDSNSERLLVPLLPPAFPIYPWEPEDRIWNVLRILPAIVCAWMGWWLGRRNNLPRKAQAGWGVFHLLFGIPGLLAFLAVQEWPARETCPKCGKLRVVNRDQCEHCGADFPSAEKTGTEIFEPLTAS